MGKHWSGVLLCPFLCVVDACKVYNILNHLQTEAQVVIYKHVLNTFVFSFDVNNACSSITVALELSHPPAAFLSYWSLLTSAKKAYVSLFSLYCFRCKTL